jgi:hypothetical protein
MTKPMLKQCLHREATFRDATANGRRNTARGLRTALRAAGTGGLVSFLWRILCREEKAQSSIPPARLQAVLGAPGMRDHERPAAPAIANQKRAFQSA